MNDLQHNNQLKTHDGPGVSSALFVAIDRRCAGESRRYTLLDDRDSKVLASCNNITYATRALHEDE